MADVNFVCVRADVEHAEALADMFEAVGFTTDGAPGEGEAAAPACIILWSHAAARSRPFLDAAGRQIGVGNALIACLSEPPQIDEIEGAELFDLSAWNGNANDEAVDALFFEVDRRVMKARAKGLAQPARAVALQTDDDPPPAEDIAPAETDYFAQYGSDAFAGLPAGAWCAPAETRIETAGLHDLPERQPRTYRGKRDRLSIVRHGGAAMRLMALVLLVGSGVAFAATSLAPRAAQQAQYAAHAPLSTVVAADTPAPEFVPEPDPYEEAFNAAPSHVREPASAPASAWRDVNAAYVPPAEAQMPAPLPYWLEAELSYAPLAGAPLVVSPQEAAALGSEELPDELFKPDHKAPAAA